MTETFVPFKATVSVHDKVFETSIMMRVVDRAVKEEMGICFTAKILGYDNGETPEVANDLDPLQHQVYYDGDWTAPKKPGDGVTET